jgi:TetR/AcrR family transcriptional regulator, transcriptional repressor for nem operon
MGAKPSARRRDTRERMLAAAEPMVLRQGFAGTSLGDLLHATGLTKGAFFHHFADKADFARALAEHYRANHFALFERFAAEADAASDDPLDATLGFLRRFEAFIEARTTPLAGCLYAAYTYQSRQFDERVQTLVAESLKRWTALYEARFGAILAHYRPAAEVSAAELAEMIVTIVEGGLVLSRSYGDPHLVARQSRQFRNYLRLLFGERVPRPAAQT